MDSPGSGASLRIPQRTRCNPATTALAVWLVCRLVAAFEEVGEDGGGGADNPAFWDGVYQRQGLHGRQAYEWYGLGFQELKPALESALPVDGQLLVLGSGDSDLSADLANAGWKVTSLDFSAQVTKYMQQRYPGLEFVTQDARNMTFKDGHFASAVDKGLSDCIATPAERRSYFQEVRRVIRVPAGALAVISQRPLTVQGDLGPGWQCEPRMELHGPLFVEDSPNSPPRPQPGTEGQIPYYFLACRSLGISQDAPPVEDDHEDLSD